MFNKDLYYKKYLKYKNKYINLQSQIGGKTKKVSSDHVSSDHVSSDPVSSDPVSSDPVSSIGPLIVSSTLDKNDPVKVVKTRRREFKPPLDQLNNPTTKHDKPRVSKKSNDVPRLLPYFG